MASEMDEHKASLRENVLFYVTAFFCLVAIFSLFIFLFLVPFFIEPALATIYMEFDPEPVICETTEASFHRGLSNCQWSSCREGCTKEVYECWHIRVRYRSPVPVGDADARSVRDRIVQHKSSMAYSPLNEQISVKNSIYGNQKGQSYPVSPNSGFGMAVSSVNSYDDRIQSVLPEEDDAEKEGEYALADEGGEGLHVHEARLQPNVKGCGYPPDVECNNTFASTYGILGANFSCYYSLIDPTLAITQLNIAKVRAELIYCLTIPIILFVISVVYLFYAYFKLYAEPTADGAAATPRGPSLDFDTVEGKVEGVVVRQPMSSPVNTGGKYGLLYQFPSPDSTRIIRRAKSGGAITFAAAGQPTEKASKETAVVFSGMKNSSGESAAHSKGMRISKSMGPGLGEGSIAAAQRNPGSFTHISSTMSSAPCSSSSSSTTSLSSQSDFSSPSHLPASLYSESSGCNTIADLSVTSTATEIFPNDNELEYYSPNPNPTNQYTKNHSTLSGNSGRQRRRLRECIPLISNNH
ncbi:hypothetical protein OUZ56_004359 [Daphnia magna]|uniref:Protein tipE n=1 Tax=Daphnia magna TaxID=35525 RepID=A0ABQ9YPI9_9CRUS|nr:hypothetical protein OUZ56_004359 [Daphnia magna]